MRLVSKACLHSTSGLPNTTFEQKTMSPNDSVMPKDSDNGFVANLLKCANIEDMKECEAPKLKSVQAKCSYKHTLTKQQQTTLS